MSKPSIIYKERQLGSASNINLNVIPKGKVAAEKSVFESAGGKKDKNGLVSKELFKRDKILQELSHGHVTDLRSNFEPAGDKNNNSRVSVELSHSKVAALRSNFELAGDKKDNNNHAAEGLRKINEGGLINDTHRNKWQNSSNHRFPQSHTSLFYVNRNGQAEGIKESKKELLSTKNIDSVNRGKATDNVTISTANLNRVKNTSHTDDQSKRSFLDKLKGFGGSEIVSSPYGNKFLSLLDKKEASQISNNRDAIDHARSVQRR